MSDIVPTPSVTYTDISDGETVLNDIGTGSDVDYVEYDGDGEYHATEQVNFTESLYYQTERGFSDQGRFLENLAKDVTAKETGNISLSEAVQVGLGDADQATLGAAGKVKAGFGNGGFGQLGFGGLSNVSG